MYCKWGNKKMFGRRKKVCSLQRPGIEPGPPAWQASILPLNQRCLHIQCALMHNLKAVEMSMIYLKSFVFAVGRIRTCAPRGNLISSQTP